MTTAVAIFAFGCNANIEIPENTDVPTVAAPELDLGDVIERARRSFLQSGNAYYGAQATYAVRVEHGVVEIKPTRRQEYARNVKVPNTETAPLILETVAITRDHPFDLGPLDTKVDSDGTLRISRGVAEERFSNHRDGLQQTWHFEQEPRGKDPLTVRVEAHGQRWVEQNEHGHHFVDDDSSTGMVYGPATWIDAKGDATPLDVSFDGRALIITVPSEVLANSSYPAVLDPVVFAEVNVTTPVAGASAYGEDTPAIATNGTNMFVVWADIRDGVSFDIYGTRVTPGATPGIGDATGVLIATGDADQIAPAIAFNGTDYLVVWSERRTTNLDLYARRVSTTGALLGAEIALAVAAGDQSNVAIDRAGTDWFVTWQDARSGTDEIWAARVNNAGAVIDAPFAVAAAPTPRRTPSIACEPARCLIVWADGAPGAEDIRGARVAPGGVVLDPASLLIAGPLLNRQLLPDVAFGGGQYVVVWQDYRTASFDVLGNRVVAASGATLDGTGFIINNSAGHQQSPAIELESAQFMVTWHDSRAGGAAQDIYAARVQSDATVIDPTGIVINGIAGNQTLAALATRGGQAFIVWQDDRYFPRELMGTTLTNAGVVLNAAGTTLAMATNRQIAGTIDNAGTTFYVIAFTDSRLSGGANYDIVAVRTNANGTTIAPPGGLVISGGPGNQVAPDVVYNGAQYFVTWMDNRNGNYDIFAARLNGAFVLQDPNGIAVTTAANDQSFPRATWNNDFARYMVVWGDRRNGTDTDIYAARVRTNAVIDDPMGIPIVIAAGDQTRPDINSNIFLWMIAWTDARGGVGQEDIRGTLLNGDTSVINADFPISIAAGRQEHVAVAATGAAYLVAWTDGRNGVDNTDIYASRISIQGAVTDPTGIALANTALNESRPALSAWTGTSPNTFAVWREQAGVGSRTWNLMGQRFTTPLAPVEAPFAISTLTGAEDQPDVARVSRDNTMVLYQRFDSGTTVRSERMKLRRITFP